MLLTTVSAAQPVPAPVVAPPAMVHPAPVAHAPAHGDWHGDCGSCGPCCDCCAPVCCEKKKKHGRKDKKCECCEVPCCDTCHSCGAPADHHAAPAYPGAIHGAIPGAIPGAVIPGVIQPSKPAETIKKMPKDE